MDSVSGQSGEKDTRIALRATSEAKEHLEQAAALRGMSLTAFVLSAAVEEAQRVITEYQSVKLVGRQSGDFLERVMEPLPANRALVELFEGE